MDLTASLMITVPLIFYVGIQFYVDKLEKKKSCKLYKKYKDDLIMFNPYSNFFGIKSAGVKQIKGNGVILLTDKKIVFERFLPEMKLEIPVDNIIEVEEVDSFLGKTKNQSLLKIDFEKKDGTVDSSAWLLDETKVWKIELKKLRN